MSSRAFVKSMYEALYTNLAMSFSASVIIHSFVSSSFSLQTFRSNDRFETHQMLIFIFPFFNIFVAVVRGLVERTMP